LGSESGQSKRRAVLALTLFIMLALAVESLAPAITIAKPKRDHGVHGQIVGGQVVPQGDLTFMAFVEFEIEDDVFQCGGSLIDASHVLTAAHCADDGFGNPLAPDAFTIFIGSANIDEVGPANKFGVAAVFQHPDWDPNTLENDVAVLELDRPVPSNIAQPLRLVKSAQFSADTVGKDALVAGWGVTEGGNTSNRLREATITLVDSIECSAAYGSQFDSSTILCAAFPERDSCFGDSGGPLIDRAQIGTKKQHKKGRHKHHKKKRKAVFADVESGIVSFGGEFCADPDFPGVYTRLSSPEIKDFISGVLNN
jgi:trypsin